MKILFANKVVPIGNKIRTSVCLFLGGGEGGHNSTHNSKDEVSVET